ncbi:MAG: hypothetical protein M9958_09500 [Chitinophagales bacterium]|nr:hypothetical protein [Chitinophagales bacterium]
MVTEIHLDPEKWNKVELQLQQRFGKVPDLQTITYLIGHRELGMLRSKFTKEEKQELMHVGVCTLLAQAGYYELKHKDEDGWPHFEKIAGTPRLDGNMQDMLLKVMIIEYFENM